MLEVTVEIVGSALDVTVDLPRIGDVLDGIQDTIDSNSTYIIEDTLS